MVELLRAILTESASVAAALGISLPVSIDRRLQAGISVGEHKTSMLQDLEAGKPLEVDCLTGAVIELARLVGVDVPHTEAVHACVTVLDALREPGLTPKGCRCSDEPDVEQIIDIASSLGFQLTEDEARIYQAAIIEHLRSVDAFLSAEIEEDRPPMVFS